MIGHSLLYFLLVAFCASACALAPSRWRMPILLAANLIFYSQAEGQWWPLAAVIGITFCGAKLLGRFPQRPWIFAAVIVLQLIPLIATKYVRSDLPLGVSFFTFFAIGYICDVYRGRLNTEPRFAEVAAGISLFPLLTAGPIERGPRLLPQLRALPGFEYERWSLGLRLIAIGLFKKLVIADALAPAVIKAFNDPEQLSGYALYAAAILARYQIFADFSGYTDIARGSARLMGIDVMENFDRPFAARSIAEHWRRWHMSLSSWMRDYVFMPLVSSPFWRLGLYGNVIITFFILGLWHGPTANFILYGTLQGLFIAAYDGTRLWRERWPHILPPPFHHAFQTAFTFLFFVSLPTVFFFASSFGDSVLIFKKIFLAPFTLLPQLADLEFLGDSRRWGPTIVVILGLEAVQYMFSRPTIRPFDEWPWSWRWLSYSTLIFIFVLLGNFGAPHDFIYRHF